MDFAIADGYWFDYVSGEPKEGRVKIRVLDGDDVRVIEKATQKKGVEYKGPRGARQRFEFTDVDAALAHEMQIDLSIVEWENTSFNGKKLDCTKENKIMMVLKVPQFRKIYTDGIEKINNDDLDAYGTTDEVKN